MKQVKYSWVLLLWGLLLGTGWAESGVPWADGTFNYRVRVTLPEIESARTDSPVFIFLDDLPQPVSGSSLAVYEWSNRNNLSTPFTVYNQPDGTVRTLYWVASGLTNAGNTRVFYVYFNEGSDTVAWEYGGGETGYVVEQGPGGYTVRRRYHTLESDVMTLRRGVSKGADGNVEDPDYMYTLYRGVTPPYTYFRKVSESDAVIGFRSTWAFQGHDELCETLYGEMRLEAVEADRNGPVLAMSFNMTRPTPINHQIYLSQRLFDGQVLSEYVFSLSENGGGEVIASDSPFNGKFLMWDPSLGFDRMITHVLEEEDLPIADTLGSGDYAVVYNSSTQQALGMFSSWGARIKVVPGDHYLVDVATDSVRENRHVRNLHARGTKEEVLNVFRSLSAGFHLADVEVPGYTLVYPRQDFHYVTGETISVRIIGSDLSRLNGELIPPEGEAIPLTFTTVDSGAIEANDVLTVTPSTPKGEWQIQLSSRVKSVNQTFYVLDLLADADQWTFPSRQARREITLPAAPYDRDRAPVFLDLRRLGPADIHSIKVDDLSGDAPENMEVTVAAQSSGEAPRAFWFAPGTTAANTTRRFMIYYNHTEDYPVPYEWDWTREGRSFWEKEVIASGNSPRKFAYKVYGDRVNFLRTARDTHGNATPTNATFYASNPEGEFFTSFTDKNNSFSPLDGMRLTYAIRGHYERIAFNEDGAEIPFSDLVFDKNGPTAGLLADYHLDSPIPHNTQLALRFFEGLPLMEYVVTVRANDGQPLQAAPDEYSSRIFYWDDAFEPVGMVTDVFGEGPVIKDRDVKYWTVLYDASNQAMGLFTFHAGPVRVDVANHAIEDTYGSFNNADMTFSYLFGAGTKEELVRLFSEMKAGVELGFEQEQGFNIMEPQEGDAFLPEESIQVAIQGPELQEDCNLHIHFPDGTVQSHQFPQEEQTRSHQKLFDLGAVTYEGPFGVWTLVAESAGITRTRNIQVSLPQTPRVLFDSQELAAIQARWNTDAYWDMWLNMDAKTGDIMAALELPPVDIGEENPRLYARDLLFLGVSLLKQPGNAEIRDFMWQSFDRIISWPEWDPIDGENGYFAGDEVGRGEVLTVLALIYDWHFNDINVTLKRNYAEKMAQYAQTIQDLGYIENWPVNWRNFIWVNYNKYFLQNAGAAIAERAVRGIVNDAKLQPLRERLDANLDTVLAILAHDGTTNEGMSYNTMAQLPLLQWLEAKRMDGRPYIMNNSPYFDNTPESQLYFSLPGRVGNFGGLLPYGDCISTPFGSHRQNMALLARRRADPVAQWIAEKSDYIRVEPFFPLWVTFDEVEPVHRESLPNWKFFPDRGIFTFRSSWENDALFFASKCGPYWGGHEHPDDGSFFISKNGFPYISPPHYLLKSKVRDQNILVSNDAALQGRSLVDGFGVPTPPENWPQTTRHFGSADFFHVQMDLDQAYEVDAKIDYYQREVVGFDDVVFLRDTVQNSEPSDLEILFHAVQTDVQTEINKPYDYWQNPDADPFEEVSRDRVFLRPNPAVESEKMTILDISPDRWGTEFQDSMVYPGFIPGPLGAGEARPENEEVNQYKVGRRMVKTMHYAESVESLQIFYIRDASYGALLWDEGVAEAGALFYPGGPGISDTRLKVVWPKNDSLDNSENLSGQGDILFRNYENQSFGGIQMTSFKDHEIGDFNLIEADHPIHGALHTLDSGRMAYVATTQAVNLRFYHPAQPVKSIYLDGQCFRGTWWQEGDFVNIYLPRAMPDGVALKTSEHLPPADAVVWESY